MVSRRTEKEGNRGMLISLYNTFISSFSVLSCVTSLFPLKREVNERDSHPIRSLGMNHYIIHRTEQRGIWTRDLPQAGRGSMLIAVKKSLSSASINLSRPAACSVVPLVKTELFTHFVATYFHSTGRTCE